MRSRSPTGPTRRASSTSGSPWPTRPRGARSWPSGSSRPWSSTTPAGSRPDAAERAVGFRHLARILRRLGRWDQIADLEDRMEAILGRVLHDLAATRATSLELSLRAGVVADFYRDAGDLRRAAELYTQEIEGYLEGEGPTTLLARALANLAEVSRRRERWSLACGLDRIRARIRSLPAREAGRVTPAERRWLERIVFPLVGSPGEPAHDSPTIGWGPSPMPGSGDGIEIPSPDPSLPPALS